MKCQLTRSCCWILLVVGGVPTVSAQPVALPGPAPVPPAIDAPTRRLPPVTRSRRPHETWPEAAAAERERPKPFASAADIRLTAGSPLPLLANFEGAQFDGHSFDFVVAAGPRHLVVATNNGIALQQKDGTLVTSLGNMAAFFDSVRQPQETAGDPRVIYDASTERFFVAAIGSVQTPSCSPGTCVAHFFVAVSKGPAPAGLDIADWYFYALDATLDGATPTVRWADYVQLGLNETVVVLTANMNPFGSSSGSIRKIRVLDKAQLVSGQPVSWADFVDVRDPASGASFFRPALHYERTDRFFLLGDCVSSTGTVSIVEIRDALSSPRLSFQSVPLDGCRPLPYSLAQQPGGRPLSFSAPGAVVYRNNSLWNAQSTVADANGAQVAAVLWYQIDVGTSSAPATVVQTSVLTAPDVHYFMPALIVDAADNVAMVLARSSAVEAASLYYTGRLVSDPAGSLRTPSLLKAGTATLFLEDHRYGDYFGAAIDPVDGSAWLTGQYASGPTETTMWVGQVELPGLAGRQLLPGHSIKSASGRFRLLYQADGDLVVYDDETRAIVWSADTSATSPGRALLQLDGNLVVNDASGSERWASGTGGNRNAYLVVQDDGNLVIFSWDGRPVWDRLRNRR